MIWLLIFASAIAGYILLLWLILHVLPTFRKFFIEASGFWAKAWAASGRSSTILWGYVLAGVGTAAQWIEPLGSLLGDPEFKSQLATTLQSRPEALGYVLIAISVVTILARLRTISRGA